VSDLPGTELTPEVVRTSLKPVLEKYGIRRAILFGSVARGDASQHSDVDLVLVQQTDKRFFDRYDGLLAELNQALAGHAVEALIYTPEELEAMKDRPFIEQILAEGIVIHEPLQATA